MNLQCPNCLKPLTVPDQYAGQMMKCPLCTNTFSVPPQTGGAELPPPTTTPPLPVSTPIPVQTPTPTPGPTDAPYIRPTTPTSTPVPAAQTPATAPATTPVAPAGADGDYAKVCAVYFTARVMQWFAPVALMLIFVLQFFPWVGLYPGGVSRATQGAWGAAFGAVEPDQILQVEALPESLQPGVSGLMVFYVLLFLPLLVLTIAALLVDVGLVSPAMLPPNFKPLLRWRWAAVAAANLIVFVFLALQLVMGFGLETKVHEIAAKASKDIKPPRQAQVVYGKEVAEVARTTYLSLAFWLHLVALVGAYTTFCLHDRSAGKPAPKLELAW